jgi:transcriptional regulator GlxA family with amidase domain
MKVGSPSAPHRRVIFAAVPPVQIIDLTAPYEVFARCGGYRVELVTNAPLGMVTSSCGLSLSGAKNYRSVRGEIDTVMVPGGDGAEALLCDGAFIDWLRRIGTRARRIGSICTGAFLLAKAGILDGRRAVTHWDWCGRLAQAFPNVRVEQDPIYIKEGNVYTSAGVTAGIDLALAMVEEDHGHRRALEIARDLVVFMRRSGGQSQFSSLLAAQASSRRPVEELQGWIVEHLRGNLGVAALARRCGMSPRHFARVFGAEKGITPARFVERIRVDAARGLLEAADYGLKEVATRAGFGGVDSMRRSFLRVVGVTPGEYARRFRTQTE